MRWRYLVYKLGYRPKARSVFYSPTLDFEHAGECGLCGRSAPFDGRAVGGLWICADPRDCDRHGPPRTLAWKLSSVAGTTMIVADNILHAVKREAKMWTWHR